MPKVQGILAARQRVFLPDERRPSTDYVQSLRGIIGEEKVIAKLHMFDGEGMTISEANKRCPRISDASLRRHIAAGRNTTAEVMNYDPSRCIAAGARKAYAARGKPSMFGGSFGSRDRQ